MATLACAVPLALASMLAACGDDADTGGSITISESAQPDALDPALSNTVNGWEAMWLVYTPLLTYRHAEGQRGTELIPGLAEKLPEISADGMTYRLRLREGLTYSDGKAVKASDFEHTVKRLLELGSAATGFFAGVRGAAEYAKQPEPDGDIAGIETDDANRSITIELTAPDGTFSNVLATLYTGVVPGNTPFRNLTKKPPPGVGAFRIARSSGGGGFVLERVEDFELPGIPAAKVDRVTMKVVAPPRAAQDVLRGKLDYMLDPPPPDMLREVRSHPDRYREVPSEGTSYFFLNTNAPPFDKLGVRRAVNLAISEDALARVHGGLMEPTCNFLPPGMPGYEKLEPCPYGQPGKSTDVARARRLVRDAGATGAPVKLWGPQQDPGPPAMSYLADVLDEIGLDPTVSLLDFAVYAQTVGNLRTHPQAGFMSWAGDFPHPFTFLRQFDSRAITATNNFNVGEVRDPVIDAGLERLSREPDLQAVKDEWAALDRRVVDRAYVAVYGNPKRTTFMSERMDFENCATFHPVFGNDYSGFCLK